MYWIYRARYKLSTKVEKQSPDRAYLHLSLYHCMVIRMVWSNFWAWVYSYIYSI